MDSIKKTFNLKSLAHTLMWLGMFGIGLTMLSGMANATILDAAISPVMHMLQGIVYPFTGGGLDTIGTVIGNTMEGYIWPNNLESMFSSVAGGGSSHAAAAAAGHVHGSALISNQWQWFGSLMPFEQDKMIEGAAFYAMPLDRYIADWCAQNGLTFGF